MPKFKVDTNAGAFEVELDRPPSSSAELMNAIEDHLNAKGGTAPAADVGLIPKDIGQQAAQQSRQEAEKTSGQLFRNVAVPVAQAGLSMALPGAGGLIPGMVGRAIASPFGQSVIGSGVEYGLQKAGLNPESGTQIGAQAVIPFASKGIEAAKGATRFVGNLVGKGQQAGEQAAAKVMKVPVETVERAQTPAASKALYSQAENAGMVDVTKASSAIQDAIDAETKLGSQADKATLQYLEGIKNDLAQSGGTMDAETMVAKAQRLQGKTKEAFLRKSPTRGEILKEATSGVKGAIPGLKEADTAYTREQVVDDVFNALSKGKKVEAVDKLLRDQGDKMLSVMSEPEIRDIRLIASRMMGQGGDVGLIKHGVDAAVKSFLADPNGLTVFRHAFGPTMERLKPERLAGLMTFIRAYEAQKHRQP